MIANRGGDDVHLPLILTSELDCNVPGVSYSAFPVIPPPTDLPAEEHADLNLALRNYEPTTADLELQDYGGDTDPNAPQLDTLFADLRLPTFTVAYQVHHFVTSSRYPHLSLTHRSQRIFPFLICYNSFGLTITGYCALAYRNKIAVWHCSNNSRSFSASRPAPLFTTWLRSLPSRWSLLFR